MLKNPLVSVGALATLVVALSLSTRRGTAPTPLATSHTLADGAKLLRSTPVAFVPNVGQWAHAARYVARIGATTVFLGDDGWTFTLVERSGTKDAASVRGTAMRMTIVGAREPSLVAEERLPGCHNYFHGSDPTRWQGNVPLYASVRYREVQPGVDVRARENAGHFEYDLLLQPDADLGRVEIAVEGVDRMRVDDEGTLVLETHVGPVRMPAPRSWEEGPSGERTPVACHYVLRGDAAGLGAPRFGFETPGRQPGWALVVDPGLLWSTYLGGRGGEDPSAIAVDARGATTVAGFTDSPDFPTTLGAFDTILNGTDTFVTRLAPDGANLDYSTFLGGAGSEVCFALALDAQGAAIVAGSTGSADFPTTPGAFDTSYNSGPSGDAFVTRLSPTGSSLVYSTFLGGSGVDVIRALAIDARGEATVAGRTESSDFPTTPGAFDTSFNSSRISGDAFVTRLTPTGSSLIFSTFLGGLSDDGAYGLALDPQGGAIVAGGTSASDFPTTPGAFDTTLNGTDVFVTRLSPNGASLVYSTFLGGRESEVPFAIAVDAQGAATIVGISYSVNFPTTPGAFDTSFNAANPFFDAFVTRLSPSGSSLEYSTFLGGSQANAILAVAVDARGAATVAGVTTSADFPTTRGAYRTTFNGALTGDAFVAQLAPTGSSLVYSTFLGGSQRDDAHALALDAQGAATVAGLTISNDYPTTPGAFDTSFNGGTLGDAFLTRLDLLPTGVVAFGRSSAGCAGPLAISVTSMPQVGNAAFALTCGNAPPNTSGLLALTGARFASPVLVLGAEIWVDPTRVLIQLPATSNTVGASDVPLPIPNGPWLRGTRLFAQFFWASPTSPPPCPPQGLSASHALEFTIQP